MLYAKSFLFALLLNNGQALLEIGILNAQGDDDAPPAKFPFYAMYYSIRTFDIKPYEGEQNTYPELAFMNLQGGYMSSKKCKTEDGPRSRAETFMLALNSIDKSTRVPTLIPRGVIPMQDSQEARAIIGPYCPDKLNAALMVTHSFKSSIMHVTYGGVDRSIDSFKDYTSFFRTAYNRYDQFKTIFNLFTKQRLKEICILYDPSHSELDADYKAFHDVTIKDPNFNGHYFQTTTTDGSKDASIREDLSKCNDKSRVVGLFLRPRTIWKYLMTAGKMQYTTGSHVFFAVDPFGSIILDEGAPASWTTADLNEISTARQNYASLLVVRVSYFPESSDVYKAFLKRYEKTITETYEKRTSYSGSGNNIQYQTTSTTPGNGSTSTMNYFGCAAHNALMLIAETLIETFPPSTPDWNVNTGLDFKTMDHNVKKLIEKAKNRVVQKGCAGKFYIDNDGHLRESYSLMGMTDLQDGKFTPVLQYDGLTDKWSDTLGTFKFTKAGVFPPNFPACGYKGEICAAEEQKKAIAAGVAVPLFLISVAVAYYIYRGRVKQAELDRMWIAKAFDLKLVKPGSVKPPDPNAQLGKKSSKRSKVVAPKASGDSKSMGAGSDVYSNDKSTSFSTPTKGRWKKMPVTVSWAPKRYLRITEKLVLEVRVIMKLRHENFMKFLGGCLEKDKCVILYEYCSRGSLEEMVINPEAKFEWPLRFSFINDLVRGMHYIHSSTLKVHGRLKSKCCYIDSRFTLKIADAGLNSFFDLTLADYWAQKRQPDYYNSLFPIAPEHLRTLADSYFKVEQETSKEGDVYSFSIILQEIILKIPAYTMHDMEPYRIFVLIKREPASGAKPFRPIIDETACHIDMIKLCEKCWSENPSDRPSFNQIRVVMKDVVKTLGMGDKMNILETLLAQMEDQTAVLEEVIEEKTILVLKEKERSDKILFSNLPLVYAESLIRGEPIEPVYLDVCSVLTVDITNFDKMVAISDAYDTAELLNDLHIFYKDAAQKYDCYILESLNQRITVVSGIPIRNGILHARELARLSLTLLFQSKFFVIKHLRDERIQIRLGTHSGPTVFGVVGKTVPRFGLFGDITSIAERIVSTEHPFKIRLSASNRNILEAFGSFRTFESSDVFVKGHGLMKTFNLVGEEGNVELQALQRKYTAADPKPSRISADRSAH